MRRTGLAAVGLGVALLALSSAIADSANAQAAKVTTDVGPHYVGEAVSIRLTAAGFEEDLVPSVEVSPPTNGSLDLVGVSPSVSQSLTIVNGQLSRTREVIHVFQYRYVAARSGTAILGPFRIVQGSREAPVAAFRLKIQPFPTSADLRVKMQLPSGPVFVGERVPVTVSFTLEDRLQQNVLKYRLHVALFDDEAFRFLDEGHQGDKTVRLETQAGSFEVRGRSSKHREGNKQYTTVTVTRTLVPLAPGRYEIPPTTLRVEEGVRYRSDFFGGRRATKVRRWQAEDPGSTLEVAEIPGQQQPPSFGGGIGRGFTVEVSADRTVVQVGDPITLTLLVRGEGLETASLPPLDAEGLLSAEDFRVAGDVPTGDIDGDAKRFTAVVRVLSDKVSEIPALAYSWFDPFSRGYQTTHSRPIALSVRSAEVIGARDVEVSEARGDVDEFEVGSASAASDSRPRARSFALTGADLGIVHDPLVVLAGVDVWGGAWLPRTLYAGSALLLGLAVWDRRRRQVDPEQARRGRLFAEEVARVKQAASVEEIAQALRRMLREKPVASTQEIDTFLGECDARSYAPSGSELGLDKDFHGQATRLAEEIAESGR